MSKKNFHILNNVVGKTKCLTNISTDNNYFGIFTDGSYIFVACANSKLRVYTFDGTSFTLITTSSEASTYYDVWSDGTYIYACCYEGVRVYSFNGTTLTQLAFNSSVTNLRRICGDGTYIYCAKYNDAYLIAYSFNGSVLSLRGQAIVAGGYAVYSFATGGGYLHVFSGFAIRAYSFNGTTFTQINYINLGAMGSGSCAAVYHDGTYIYVIAQGEYVYQLTFNGTAYTIIKQWFRSIAAQTFLNMWGDGKYVYVAGDKWGVYTFDFNGTAPWLIGENRHKVNLMGITGDANYIYATAQYPQGIIAYKLLEKY